MITFTQTPPPAERQWLKITFFCPSQLLEPTTDLLGVLSGAGVEQSPEIGTGAMVSGFFQLISPLENAQHSETGDDILARVMAQMTELFALYGCAPEKPVITLLADEDWATSWQQYFKPFEIVPGLIIKPSWEEFVPKQGQHILELDPGMAFGTGQHASTRMALDLIRQCLQQTATVTSALDVGTGTGILAMAAVLFGAERVVAIDNDPDAVIVAGENIAKNRLGQHIAVSTTPADQIPGTYGLVCANIVHDVLTAMAPILTRLTAPGGHLVLAGILRGDQEDNILAVYSNLGCQACDRQYQDEWVALLLQRR